MTPLSNRSTSCGEGGLKELYRLQPDRELPTGTGLRISSHSTARPAAAVAMRQEGQRTGVAVRAPLGLRQRGMHRGGGPRWAGGASQQ